MERRRDSDRRVADRRQDSGKDIAASVLTPEYHKAKTTPLEGTTVFDVESAQGLIVPALDESNRFFAKDIASLEIPDEFYRTEERLREIGFTRVEPLVLPQRTLLENDPLWEGRVKPGPWFWEKLQNGRLKAESATLQPVLSLIDGRPKPDYRIWGQSYKDDGFMKNMVRGLRRKGEIQRYTNVPDDSRFGRSPEEIEQVILPELARAIGKDALGSEGRVVNNTYLIFNVVGNMRHPEWHKTKTSEWFGDRPGPTSRLIGGNSDSGGLAHVYSRSYTGRSDDVGFRPRIDFPSKT